MAKIEIRFFFFFFFEKILNILTHMEKGRECFKETDMFYNFPSMFICFLTCFVAFLACLLAFSHVLLL